MPKQKTIFQEGSKRPEPPEGWIRTKKPMGKCPRCDTKGHCSGPGFLINGEKLEMFQDPGANEALKYYEGIHGDHSYHVFCGQYDGVMLKCHWSRVGTSTCINCNLNSWHDFVTDIHAKKKNDREWHYYHEPFSQKEWDRKKSLLLCGIRKMEQVSVFTSIIFDTA